MRVDRLQQVVDHLSGRLYGLDAFRATAYDRGCLGSVSWENRRVRRHNKKLPETSSSGFQFAQSKIALPAVLSNSSAQVLPSLQVPVMHHLQCLVSLECEDQVHSWGRR